MYGPFDFNGLLTFEMANNHQGDVEHGKRIIREIASVVKNSGINKAAIKLQFRDLDTFIHPAHKENKENKHISRFLSTRLTDEQFQQLVNEIRMQGLLAMCTPFDEPSVDKIVKMSIDIIKIGSCSATDWPLLEKAATAGKPIIVSTGGLSIKDIDNLVSFFDHRYVNFAVMHCVSVYPTPAEKFVLDKIDFLRQRYPNVTIGFSTHEDPNNYDIIKMAYAKGARIFERHVGVPTETIKLNSYSSTPEQIANWLSAYNEAIKICGSAGQGGVDPQEQMELRALMRGVYLKNEIKMGEEIKNEDVFFAIPAQEGQMLSGQWKVGFIADRDYPAMSALSSGLVQTKPLKKQIIYQAIHEIKGMLNIARISVGSEFEVEMSHHYGIENFRETGVTIINCINREYCKKILVTLPGQEHPYHHHKKKEETFQILSGILEVELDGRRRTLTPGDILVVQRGVTHKFWSDSGAIFEEVSTTHFNDDSLYADPAINEMPREARKTKLVNWGRHQFD